MASSSSPSCPSHSMTAPSSKSWNHDVFLSFRGEDTRKTFVDHLYTALEQEGIYTYKDDVTVPRGESIGPSLLKAIQESRIAVIVFSKNYADSSWCLEELETIMECRHKSGQIVLPIFYDVNPSEVRKQKGEFGEAFAKLELVNNNRVESWRKALMDASNIAGWEPKHVANGHESRCIKEIVDTISLRLIPLMSSTNTDLIGIKTRVQQLKSRLEIGSGDVRMVGIWGVGGGGKTTLAFSIYKEISREFDGCSFIENVREESSKHGLKKLQEKLLLDVLKGKGVYVGNLEEGKWIIKSRLCRKSVLIILDDVNQCEQLEALAGSNEWFGGGSRIIITTRDVNLLEAHRVNIIHDVSLLEPNEAIQLFSRHAFGKFSPVEGYEELSQDVVSKASGLPLALKILGSFLCGKDMNEWISALARLKDIPDGKIFEKLKISYDGLERLEKELFLDIACFHRWEKTDSAITILDACGFHPVIGVKVLIQKALITISDGRFNMHDMVQEMGHHIVREEHPNNPQKHNRIWQDEDVLNICSGDTTTIKENEKIEALKFHSWNDPPPHFLEVIANMRKLRFLDVRDFKRKLVKGPEFLSNKLQWISWTRYSGSLLPTSFQPTKLGGLILHQSLLKQLWKGYKCLPNLKVISLRHSMCLIKTPDFDGLPNLERLVLATCRNLIEIHASIGRLEKLVYLEIDGCEKLRMFPPIINMKKLKTLGLSWCPQLRKFPQIQQNMDSLEHLNLSRSGIEVVPSSIGQFCTNLVSLDLHDCLHLKSIEGNFHLLKRLEVLNLKGCKQLGELPEDLFDIECCLEDLSLPPKKQPPPPENLIMKIFKNLMCYMGLPFPHKDLVILEYPHLPRFIRKLDLSWCDLEDGDIPSNICELSNLQVLDLSENKFVRLHSILSQLPRLKFLDVSLCKSLVELPVLPSSIAVLRANWCESLEIIGELSTTCKSLWKVSLWRKNKQCVIGGERLLQSMLKGNAIENHFISLELPGHEIPKGLVPSLLKGSMFTLQLPHNWYNDFTGFLLCAAFMTNSIRPWDMRTNIKQEMGIDSESELWKESDDTLESGCHPITFVGYISFGSLRHTAWWSSTYSAISFSFHSHDPYILETGCGVQLIPKKNQNDVMEPTKTSSDFSDFWDQEFEHRKTFTVEHDSKSSIKICWYNNY